MALSAQDMSLPVSRLLCTALVLLCQAGCRKAPAPATATPVVSISAQNDLVRGDRLLKVLALPHSDVAARLGPHRVESQTRWTITPIPSPRATQVQPVQPGFKLGSPAQPFSGEDAYETAPVQLSETRFVAVDGTGRLHMGSDNADRTDFASASDIEAIGGAGDGIGRRQSALVGDGPHGLARFLLQRTDAVDKIEEAADLATGRVHVKDDALHSRIGHGARNRIANFSVGQKSAGSIDEA